MYYRCIIRGYHGIDGRGRFRYTLTAEYRRIHWHHLANTIEIVHIDAI